MWRVLQRLGADPHNHVLILSARSRSALDRHFPPATHPFLGLSAEHGCFLRLPYGGWTELLPDTDLSWRAMVREILEFYTERTPGAWVEDREVCLAWNYQQADPSFG